MEAASTAPPAAALLAAAPGAGDGIALLPLVIGLAGGLALFLFGLDQLAAALKTVAGDRMRALLARLTGSRLRAVATGALVTAAIQSSSVTTVLVVGFITAGLLTLPQAVGVIMGANIGTTLTAQIIAFKVTRAALALIAAGFALTFLARGKPVRHYGTIVMGLGMVFFGMSLMGDAMAPLRSYPPFVDGMARLEQPVLGILTGAAFTALVQSSAATAGIVMVLAGGGLLSLPAGIAVIFGANVGTCVTALLAALGKPRLALQAAVVHVLFNLLGVILWLPFIDELARLVTALSPQVPELAGSARLAAEAPRQLANAHTLFNVANTLVLIGFAPWIARLAQRLAPERPESAGRTVKYLDLELLANPSLALDAARLELLHLGNRVRGMLQAVLPALLTGSREALDAVERADDAVDLLHGEIVTYLGRISRLELSERQTGELIDLLEAANDLENIGDLIETNLVNLGRHRLERGVTVSRSTREVIEQFHHAVARALEAALLAVAQKNPEAARVVVDMKREINRLESSAVLHEAQRLVAREPNRLPAYQVETDILKNLKRVYYFAKRMARVVVPADLGEG